jgi:hypothetical protein
MTRWVARLIFSPEHREHWPKSVLTAEAHLLPGEEPNQGPWSIRADLWAPPDDHGCALAWVSFLVPDAPTSRADLREGIELTLGGSKVATCHVMVMQVPQGELGTERDFLDHPDEPVRTA